MPRAIVNLSKDGSSLSIVIPKPMVQWLNWTRGDRIELIADEVGVLAVRVEPSPLRPRDVAAAREKQLHPERQP